MIRLEGNGRTLESQAACKNFNTVVARDWSVCGICNALRNFEIAHAQFANLWVQF